MKLHELVPAEGSVKTGKRKGRGIGSGNGKTAGRGHKGQWARSGGGVRPGFEGGQTMLSRRLPKRGFNNKFAKNFAEINIGALEIFDDGAVIDFGALVEMGYVQKKYDGIRILGGGQITKKLTVKAAGITESAKEKITAAGGSAEVL